MFGWLRRMLGLPLERRARPRDVPSSPLPELPPVPVAPPLPSTSAELARTAPAHRRKIAERDRFLADIRQMDAALRLVRR